MSRWSADFSSDIFSTASCWWVTDDYEFFPGVVKRKSDQRWVVWPAVPYPKYCHRINELQPYPTKKAAQAAVVLIYSGGDHNEEPFGESDQGEAHDAPSQPDQA